MEGLVYFLQLKIAISFYRSVFASARIKPETYDPTEEIEKLNDGDQIILNDVIKIINEHGGKKNLDIIITSELKKQNYYKEDWQIHYAKERIKKLLLNVIKDNEK